MSLRPMLLLVALFAWTAGLPIASAQAVEDEPADPEPDILNVSYPRRAHLALRAGAGASFESLSSTMLFGAHGSLGIGADTKALSFFGTVTGGGGKTEGGLDFYEVAAGGDLEWPIGPVRLGVRPRIGYLAIARVTQSGLMEDMRAGFGGLVGFDFFRQGGFAIGLEAEPRIDAIVPLMVSGGGETLPAYGVRLNFVVKKRMPRAGDEPAPRIGAAF